MGGARRLARVRVPAAKSGGRARSRRPSPLPSGRQRLRERRRADPARAPRRSVRARRSWRSRCCAPGGSRWGRCWSASSESSPPGSGSTTPSRCPPARPRSISASGRWAGAPGDRVITTPFSFVASANCLLYEGATPVFCDIDPLTLNLDPSAARAAVADGTVGLAAGPHLRLPGGAAGARGARRANPASGCSRTPARRPGAVDSEGVQGGRARPPGHLCLLRQQAADHGRGRA